MFPKFVFRPLVAVAAFIMLAATAAADTFGTGGNLFTLDFVPIGDAGNTADTTGAPNPCGKVDYAYRIGTYEVTIDQFTKAYNADSGIGDGDEDYWNDGGGSYGTGAPATYVSWHEAAKFCNWLTTGDADLGYYSTGGSYDDTPAHGLSHKEYADVNGLTYFIPTEDEWYKAAYYKGGGTDAGYWDYPTQHDTTSSPPIDGIDSSDDTNPGDFDAVFIDGYNQGHPNDVSNSGVGSAYGTYGQGGNVWEWNEAEIGSSRGLRGGVWGGNSSILRASDRFNYSPAAEDFSIGFRVASVPEPGSITLLVCGLLGVLLWWRRRK